MKSQQSGKILCNITSNECSQAEERNNKSSIKY